MKLEIKGLHAGIEGKEIIKGLSLNVAQGETHVIMGPNGSGKSTLAKAILGHPHVSITEGNILVDGKSLLGVTTDERAKMGLFLQFQNPAEIEGVGYINFLHLAKQSMGDTKTSARDFMKEIKGRISSLKMSEDFIKRPLNQGFSGGEKKKSEILQMGVLKPKIAILDEPDSGLDIDAIKTVSDSINEIAKRENTGLLIITHYSRILKYIKPDFVHVMVDGKIVEEGKQELIDRLEKNGYDSYLSG